MEHAKPSKHWAPVIQGLGERLKVARDEAKLTQSQLADKLGVTRTAVTQWEASNTLPSVDMCVKLSAQIGMAPEKLAFDAASLQDEAASPNLVAVPVFRLGEQADANRELYKNFLSEKYLEHFFKITDHSSVFAVEIDGDAFAPKLRRGDCVLVDGSVRRIARSGFYLISGSGTPVFAETFRRPGMQDSIKFSNAEQRPDGTPIESLDSLNVLGRLAGILSTSV